MGHCSLRPGGTELRELSEKLPDLVQRGLDWIRNPPEAADTSTFAPPPPVDQRVARMLVLLDAAVGVGRTDSSPWSGHLDEYARTVLEVGQQPSCGVRQTTAIGMAARLCVRVRGDIQAELVTMLLRGLFSVEESTVVACAQSLAREVRTLQAVPELHAMELVVQLLYHRAREARSDTRTAAHFALSEIAAVTPTRLPSEVLVSLENTNLLPGQLRRLMRLRD